MRRFLLIVSAAVGLALPLGVAVQPADASRLLGRNDHSIRLVVGARGVAQVDFVTSPGQVMHVLAWGAVNARPPSETSPQVAFRVNYAGGYGSGWGSGYWRLMHNYCRPYDGPPLVDVIASCKAVDGSYWAVQLWRRLAPDGGWPASSSRAPVELHLSHWTGSPARLSLYLNWERSNHSVQRVFGQFTYAGYGVYGYSSTPGGNPLDGYGRNVYVDVQQPRWYRTAWNLGSGWYRFNSGLSHHKLGMLDVGRSAIGGAVCLGMWPLYGRTLPANGLAYRATAMGPGVTPIVRSVVVTSRPYSDVAQAQQIQLERTFTPSTDICYSGGT